MRFDIITIFPGAFESYLSSSIIGRAVKNRLIQVKLHDLRDWANDKRRTVDDKPYGGGPGMVLKVEPIFKALRALKSKVKSQKSTHSAGSGLMLSKVEAPKLKVKVQKFETRIILLGAKGKPFTQKDAKRLGQYRRLILISGHYEGVDERVKKHLADEELSIGQYVLTGGELPAMVVIDACARLIPGVLGKKESLQDESFSQEDYLEHPHYTRPEVFKINGKNRRVPKILLSGDHKKINIWREKNSKKAG